VQRPKDSGNSGLSSIGSVVCGATADRRLISANIWPPDGQSRFCREPHQRIVASYHRSPSQRKHQKLTPTVIQCTGRRPTLPLNFPTNGDQALKHAEAASPTHFPPPPIEDLGHSRVDILRIFKAQDPSGSLQSAAPITLAMASVSTSTSTRLACNPEDRHRQPPQQTLRLEVMEGSRILARRNGRARCSVDRSTSSSKPLCNCTPVGVMRAGVSPKTKVVTFPMSSSRSCPVPTGHATKSGLRLATRCRLGALKLRAQPLTSGDPHLEINSHGHTTPVIARNREVQRLRFRFDQICPPSVTGVQCWPG